MLLKHYRYTLINKILKSLYYLIRAYSWTFRMDVENENQWKEYLKGGGRVIICCWHQQFFSAIRHFKTYSSLHPALMISQSQDGDIIANIAEKSGWHTVRGSSSREGRQALRKMIDHLKQFGFVGHVLDGPRGPAGIVKDGVISMAQATGAVIVPFYLSAERAWYFNSWDRFMLPKPFSRVRLRFGDMLEVPAQNNEGDFERQLLRLQSIMQPGLIK
ncbi:MAG TPA: lysophospholipid acyltransferase family protein [Smithella sp.]|nr:lysophospholipid acyltransferase family protein [Smithella sp.]HOU50730.1 lysophospholipid acyltransferase family protein [Smithella sp.]HQG65775.1 lysophospholipid acyltransferase family protein [Smithella sp.]HQH17379.1 lysophospholipid acyltransferase family protein [Smithella sp.]HQI72573.1 lysophospholipid acyltransferase family protein [Smithella sp.]